MLSQYSFDAHEKLSTFILMTFSNPLKCIHFKNGNEDQSYILTE